jgi:hypothetical protein
MRDIRRSNRLVRKHEQHPERKKFSRFSARHVDILPYAGAYGKGKREPDPGAVPGAARTAEPLSTCAR